MTKFSAKRVNLEGVELFRVWSDRGCDNILIRAQATNPALARDGNALEIVIWGDSGSFDYRFGSIGPETWQSFLAGCDMDYFLKKITGYKHKEMDLVATVKNVKRIVIERRRDEILDMVEAREVFDLITDIAEHPDVDERRLLDSLYDNDNGAFYEFCDGDVIAKRIKPGLIDFWHQAWRPFIEAELQKACPTLPKSADASAMMSVST